MKDTFIFMSVITIFLALTGCGNSQKDHPEPSTIVPIVDTVQWRICESPDLDSLNGPDMSRQHVVDHGFIQAEDGSWQLWACIRGTAVGRLLYRWEGKSLEEGPWVPKGIAARAAPEYGEKTNPESIQAPHFLKINNIYHCFYNSNGIRLMTSKDGIRYQRKPVKGDNNILYRKGGRDVMILRDKELFFAYSTISTISGDSWGKGFVIVRTSRDLKKWSDYTIVSEGGIAGNGLVSAESPFVYRKDDLYYLFRSSSISGKCYVYCSENPYNFGVNDDSGLVTILNVKAPEIIVHEGKEYISDLSDFKGVKLARLYWKEKSK